jgi:hypothetical protein
MQSTMQIISSWIVALDKGKVKIRGRELNRNEIDEIAIPLLQSVAAEIMKAKTEARIGRE